MDSALAEITAATEAGDKARLLAALHQTAAGISGIDDDAADEYLKRLQALLQAGAVSFGAEKRCRGGEAVAS